jgi:outer membrane lipoprotein LolB
VTALLLALLLVMLLGGCAGLPQGDGGASYPMTATADVSLDVSFHAQGRFSANYEEKVFAARFDWRHEPDVDEIEVISPFGTTVAGLTRTGKTVAVQRGDGPQHTQQMEDWETLTKQTFGFPLPVESLAYWVRGVPAPEAPATVTRDAAGRPDSLRQQGWTVQYHYAAAAREPERLDILYGETVGLRLRMDRLLLLENE